MPPAFTKAVQRVTLDTLAEIFVNTMNIIDATVNARGLQAQILQVCAICQAECALALQCLELFCLLRWSCSHARPPCDVGAAFSIINLASAMYSN